MCEYRYGYLCICVYGYGDVDVDVDVYMDIEILRYVCVYTVFMLLLTSPLLCHSVCCESSD